MDSYELKPARRLQLSHVLGVLGAFWCCQGCAEPTHAADSTHAADPSSSTGEPSSSTLEPTSAEAPASSTAAAELPPQGIDKRAPLSQAELGEVAFISSSASSYLREIPFGHCAVQTSLSRWGREGAGHAAPESEDLLRAWETRLAAERALLGDLARGYVALFGQARRELGVAYERSRARDAPTPLDPEATRQKLVEVRRLAHKAFGYLGLAAAESREPSTYAYELALLHFEMEKIREAQSLLGVISQDPAATESLKEDAQLVLGLSHLEESPDEQWLKTALTHFEAAARGMKTRPNLTGLASACYQAEILLELGKKDEAKALFRSLSTTQSPSGIHQLAARRLSEIR